MAEIEEKLKTILMRVKEDSEKQKKLAFKTQHSKSEDNDI